MLEELLQKRKTKLGLVKFRVIPQILAWVYYHVSWLLFVIKPKMSYQLNVEFEDHAEHEYMQYVADHIETDDESWQSGFKADYGDYETVGDLLRRIGLDEREHKELSQKEVEQARFSQKK